MTLGTDRKRHLLKRFPCHQHTYPKGVTVHIRDHMPDLKYKDPNITTVQEYVHKHIQRHVKDVLNDESKGVDHYYGLLDRGGNMAKKLFTSHKRNRVMPMPNREDGQLSVPVEGLLPKEWDSMVANGDMANREIKAYFYRALIQDYEPPPGKFVILDSATTQPLTVEEARALGSVAFNKVYGVKTAPLDNSVVQLSSRDLLNTPMGPTKPLTERYQCPPESYIHNIQEADLSAFFHLHKHIQHPGAPAGTRKDQSIVIDSNDGDSIWIALLGCGDRIDKATSRFNSRVWVKLRGQKVAREAHKKRKTKAAEAKKKKAVEDGEDDNDADVDADDDNDPIDGRDIYININKLYLLMDQDPDLKAAQYPVGMAVLLYILGGTDFFDDFLGDENAIFHGMGWEKCIWDTWCAHKDRFANLIMLFYTGPAGYNQPDLCRRPYIDEEAMLTFFKQCYATKYGKVVKDLYDVDRVTTDQLRAYTRTFGDKCKRKPNEADDKWERRRLMAAKKAMPEDAILRRYCRLALLNWTYWLNGYRPGGEAFCDPLEMYEGLPYYGYIIDPEHPNRYTLSPIVSPPRPVPENVLPYIGRHTAEAKAVAAQARQAAREQLAKEEAAAKEMAMEQERMERQRKLAAKQKRLGAQPPAPVKRAPASTPRVLPPAVAPATVQSRLTHTAQLSGVKQPAPSLKHQ